MPRLNLSELEKMLIKNCYEGLSRNERVALDLHLFEAFASLKEIYPNFLYDLAKIPPKQRYKYLVKLLKDYWVVQ